MPALLAQLEDENYSPPTEGNSDTPWVADRGGFKVGIAFPDWDPPPSARGEFSEENSPIQ
jgi:hypothetical protein